jgi:tetratricopeptide (TPR) repeat protein
LLVGEPGIGKTRTAEELARRAARRGVRTFWGRSHEGANFPSYWPWIELLRAWAAEVGLAPADGRQLAPAELAQLVPELREALAQPAGAEIDGEEARFRLFDTVAGFWRRESSAQPMLLVLDDLHWADAASLRLLAFLSRSLRGARLLVVGTCRDAELQTNPAIASLLADVDRETDRIRLSGVGPDDVARLIEGVTGCAPSADLATAIRERTDGNPFFVREIARALPIRGGAPLAVGPDRLPVPPAVNAVIQRQVEALDPEVRSLLATAAVVGREFELALLSRLEACPTGDLLPPLRAAARAGLLEKLEDPAFSARFAHALVRETLYDGIDGPRRCELHLRVGEALEQLHADDLDAASDSLAHHFLRGAPLAEPMRAVDYAERAGARANAVFAFEDAARHFARALDALELCAPSPERRLALLLQLGEARMQAGSLDLAAESFAAAAELARRRGAVREFARAALGFSRRRDSELGTDPECIALLEEALAASGVPAELRVLLRSRLAAARYFAGEPGEATSLARQAVSEARTLGQPETLALALGALHWIMWAPANAEERLALSRETVEQARLSGNRALYWRSTSGPLEDLLELGEMSAVDESLELYARGAAETRQPWLRWHLEISRAMRAAMSGLFAEAETRSRAALELGRPINEEVAQQWFAIQLFFVRRDQGRLGELEAPLRELAARQPHAPWRAGLARLLAEQGRDAEARALLAELTAGGVERIRQDVNWPIRLSCLAEAAGLVGDSAGAAGLYRALQPFAGRQVIIGMRVGYDGPASRYLGVLARALGLLDEAEQHLAAALGQTQKIGARPFEAYCHHDLARVLLSRGAAGDRERAAEHLARASELARSHGMEGLRRRLAAFPASARRKVVALPSTARANRGLFRREGEYWTVAYGGRVLRLRDNKGLQQIAQLLREPGREFHALDLLSAAAVDEGAAPEALDREARAAYARRLADLREDLEEAERFGDPARASRAREEIEALTRELSRAVGLGGRDRRTGTAAERARVNVARTIHLALERIAEEHPALGRLLARTIKTGVFCSYLPDPERPIEWR